MEQFTDIQIKNMLESLNMYKEQSHVEYKEEDIKCGHPDKDTPCYIIMHNSKNEDMPSMFYGGYKNGKFYKCQVSGSYIYSIEELMPVLGYVEYKKPNYD